MWVSDIPTSQVFGGSPTIVARAPPVANRTKQMGQILGVCRTLQGRESISPTSNAADYMYRYRGIDQFSDGVSVKVLLAPKDGVLQLSSYGGAISAYQYEYVPNSSTSNDGRDDFFIVQVDKGDVKVRIHYYIHIQSPDDVLIELCKRSSWKISAADPKPIPNQGNLTDWLRANHLPIMLDFASLHQKPLASSRGNG